MALDQIDVDKLENKGRAEMTFLDHLEALRWHLVRAIVAIVLCAIGVFMAKSFVFDIVLFGPRYSSFITYRLLCDISELLCFEPPDFQIITRDLAEKFLVHFKSSMVIGFVIAFPYVFWEMWRFIKPALYEKEARSARGIVFICSILFVIGVLFGYYVLSPFSISFLAGYQVGDIMATPTLASYVNYMVMFTIPIGLIFELPILIYFFSKIGLVTPAFMKRHRRVAILLCLIIAGIITPADVLTMFMVAFPLYGLYEIGIYVSARVERQRKKEEMRMNY
jgi:sec-independent protein translocase protein TatC